MAGIRFRLCTHPGKFGDILWSLPTAREFCKLDGRPVDFAIRPPYRSLIPLLSAQKYIADVFVIENWESTGSPFGDQPWESPPHGRIGIDYTIVTDLGYRSPPRDLGCARFLAAQHGMNLPETGFYPFLTVVPSSAAPTAPKKNRYIGVGIGGREMEQQMKFWVEISKVTQIQLLDLSKFGWLEAGTALDDVQCVAFVGSRSSLRVLALGLGKSTIIFEPHPGRNLVPHRAGAGAREVRVTTIQQGVSVLECLLSGRCIPLARPTDSNLDWTQYRVIYSDVSALRSAGNVTRHFRRVGDPQGRIPQVDLPLYQIIYPTAKLWTLEQVIDDAKKHGENRVYARR